LNSVRNERHHWHRASHGLLRIQIRRPPLTMPWLKFPIYYTSHNTHCRVKYDNHSMLILLIYSRTVAHITLKIPLKCSCCFSTIHTPHLKRPNIIIKKLERLLRRLSTIVQRTVLELSINYNASLAVWIRQPIRNQLLLIRRFRVCFF